MILSWHRRLEHAVRDAARAAFQAELASVSFTYPPRPAPPRGRHHRRLVGAQHEIPRGQRHRTTRETPAGPQSDVDSPVGPARFTELTGTVQGVHDPDPLGGQPGRVGPCALLGQDRVGGPPPGELCRDQLVGLPVAGGPQRVRVLETLVGAQREQQVAGLHGQPAREGAISDGHAGQYAPEPRETAVTVRMRIVRSSGIDQFSTYRRSSRTAS